MAGTGNSQPSSSARPMSPGAPRPKPAAPLRKPPQVMMIKKDESDAAGAGPPGSVTPGSAVAPAVAPIAAGPTAAAQPVVAAPVRPAARNDAELFELESLEGITMADLLGPDASRRRPAASGGAKPAAGQGTPAGAAPARSAPRTVDEFDFDEEAFLAALDENDGVGTTGEVVKGLVIGLESDGVYVDIGGKAPGFMPKKECGLGVITNLKERFPKGLELEVLVTREQNADGMVTISVRALALRQSWEKLKAMEKEAKVVQVKVTGFNRGGITCDLEGLRGFIG